MAGGINIIERNLQGYHEYCARGWIAQRDPIAALQADDHENIWASTYVVAGENRRKTMMITEVPQIIGLQGEFIHDRRSGQKMENFSSAVSTGLICSILIFCFQSAT